MNVPSENPLWRAALTVLREKLNGQPLNAVVVYMLDYLDPLGFAFARAIFEERRGPDPVVVLGGGLGFTPPRAPFGFGLLTNDELVSLALRAGPSFYHLVDRLSPAPPPLHLRLLLVVNDAAELALVPVLGRPRRGASVE